ncbi:NB-ARC domain-containing protein [Streptomyces sp. NPDC046805]|uniref:ATP-binding protein n=1 Tax=Streptomyces sp. NPDC046805 TaxID=3155134 RepID=UPI0033D740D3
MTHGSRSPRRLLRRLIAPITVSVATGAAAAVQLIAGAGASSPNVLGVLCVAVLSAGAAVLQVLPGGSGRRPWAWEAHGLTDGAASPLPPVVGGGVNAAVGAQEMPAPNTLPPSPRLVGREKALRAISAAVDEARNDNRLPVVTLHGQGGVGKSALAIRYAHDVQDDYPDGVLYVDLRTALKDTEAALAFLLRNLGATRPPAGLAERIAAYLTLLARRRVVIVLDHAKDERQIRPLLPSSPRCLVIVTRREEFTAIRDASVSSLAVDVMDREDSLELLADVAGHELIAADPQSAYKIVEGCGGLPLALRIMGRLVRARSYRPLSWHAARLHDERQRLKVLKSGSDDVAASIELSYAELGERSARAFCLLGLLVHGHVQFTFRSWTLAALLGTSVEDAESLLDELVEKQLVGVAVELPYVRYELHDLVRAFAEQRLLATVDQESRDAAWERLVWGYLRLAAVARAAIDHHGALTPQPEYGGLAVPDHVLADVVLAEQVGRDGVRWFTWEYPGLSAVVKQQHDARQWETCWRIAGAAARVAGLFSSTESWWTTIEYGIAAATRADSHLGLGQLELGAAELHRAAGEMAPTADCLDRSVESFEQAGDNYGKAAALRSRADTLRVFGWFPLAEQTAKEALEAARAAQDAIGEARAQRHLGFVYISMHRGAEAIRCLNEARVSFHQQGDRLLEGRTLIGLAAAARVERQFADAIAYADRAEVLFRDLRSPIDESAALHELGHVYLDAGQHDDAERCLQEALHSYRGLELKLQVGRVQRLLSWLRVAERRYAEAVSEANNALAVFEQVDSDYWKAQAQWCLGAAELADGQAASARARLTDVEAVFHRMEADWDRASCLAQLARAQLAEGSADDAGRSLVTAVTVFGDLGARRDAAEALRSFSRAARGRRGRRIVQQVRAEARSVLE